MGKGEKLCVKTERRNQGRQEGWEEEGEKAYRKEEGKNGRECRERMEGKKGETERMKIYILGHKYWPLEQFKPQIHRM